MQKVLFQIGSFQVRVIDVTVAVGCLILLAVLLIVIIKDIKRKSRQAKALNSEDYEPTKKELKKQRKAEEKQEKKDAKLSDRRNLQQAKADAKAAKKEQKKELKRIMPEAIANAPEGMVAVKTVRKPDRDVKMIAVKKVTKVTDAAAAKSPDKKALDASDPLVGILGFDPYSAVEVEDCEIVERYHDGELETEDMRALREKMRISKQYEQRLTVLRERLSKIRYELGKAARYIRDNRVVISSASVVSDKLRTELAAITVDKRTQKANKANIIRINEELQKSSATVTELSAAVDKRTAEERRLRDAQDYVTAEISRTEREHSYITEDVNRLDATVGVELKRIENENRARELMNKYRDLKPLLVAVNTAYRKINALDAELSTIHEKKHSIKNKIDEGMEELRVTYGAVEAGQYSRKVTELNAKMVELDNREEAIIKEKEEEINRFRIAKRKANEYLDAEKYDVEDVIAAEDKVVGELEYEQVKAEYENRKIECTHRYTAAQRKYDAVVARKVKFSRRQEDKKREYEQELQAALAELKMARSEYEKAVADCDRVLPTISPVSLVKSGSGVISRERINKGMRPSVVIERPVIQPAQPVAQPEPVPAPVAAEPRKYARPMPQYSRVQAQPQYPRSKAVDYAMQRRSSNRESGLVVAGSSSTSAQLRRLMARLNELEQIALREKEHRAAIRRESPVIPVKSGDKIERRKAQIVALRKNLAYIDSESAANEFKRKLYSISISLDEEEAADNVLNEMIRRTMAEASRLGERAARNGKF